MSRYACLAPARSLPMHDHQQRLLERLGHRSDCRYKTRRQSKRWSAEDQLVRAAMALERCYPPASPRQAAWAKRTLAAARAERRGRRPRWRQGWYRRKQLRIRRKAHRGALVWAAAERAAVVGAAYRIHGAAAIADVLSRC